jgi:hypothetical protein
LGDVDIRVPIEFRSEFQEFLTKNNLSSTVYIQDVQQLIDVETSQMNNRTFYHGNSKKEEEDFFKSYRR